MKLWTNYSKHVAVPLQQTSPRLTTPSKTPGTYQANQNAFQKIEDAKIYALCANLGYDLSQLIIYALNNITNAGDFQDEVSDFYCQHNTHNIDWPTLKKIWATA